MRNKNESNSDHPLGSIPLLLEAADLQCVRGDRVLFDHVSFSVESGELLHVRGANGSGKTTMLRMVCGLVSPSSGEIRWRGQSARKQGDEFHKELLYLGHQAGIKAELTALENLKFSSAVSGQALDTQAAVTALRQMGLKGREDLPSKVLSQGQQRRVALARLLVSKAPLWVLDEPFTALDIKAVSMLQDVLAGHVAGGGIALITTHQDFTLNRGTLRALQLGA